jgi:hypothetical protein
MKCPCQTYLAWRDLPEGERIESDECWHLGWAHKESGICRCEENLNFRQPCPWEGYLREE